MVCMIREAKVFRSVIRGEEPRPVYLELLVKIKVRGVAVRLYPSSLVAHYRNERCGVAAFLKMALALGAACCYTVIARFNRRKWK